MLPGYLPSASMNFLYGQVNFRQLCVAAGYSVNFTCCYGTFRQYLSNFCAPQDLLSISCTAAGLSLKFPCSCWTFPQLPSTLCGRWTILPLSVTCSTFCQLCAGVEPSVTFCHVFVITGKFPSTYINFPCSRRTFCQLSVRPQDLRSTLQTAVGTSVKFLCFHRTF